VLFFILPFEFAENGFIIKCHYTGNHWATHPIPPETLSCKTFKSVNENERQVTYEWVDGDNK